MDFLKQIKFWFLVNKHHSPEQYESWKHEEPIWSKSEIRIIFALFFELL